MRWHPNDRRKIRRSLEIYYSSGCKQTASEFYAAQRAAKEHQQQPADSGAGHQSKYHSLVFWVHAEQEVLRSRLDARVDKMVEAGMWHEIEEIERLYRSLDHNSANSADLDSGIWQSIGFKEFLPYLDLRAAGSAVGTEVESARAAAIENTKTATRQYARSQVRWIRIKFLNALRSAAGEEESTPRNIFLLDSTDIPQFEEKVVRPGIAIASGR